MYDVLRTYSTRCRYIVRTVVVLFYTHQNSSVSRILFRDPWLHLEEQELSVENRACCFVVK